MPVANPNMPANLDSSDIDCPARPPESIQFSDDVPAPAIEGAAPKPPSKMESKPPLLGVPTAPISLFARSAATACAIIFCTIVPKLCSIPLQPFPTG